MNTNLSTLIEAVEALNDFSSDYSELKAMILECAEKARDSADELSQSLCELCDALENLPE